MPYLNIPHGRIFYTSASPPTSPPRATILLHHGLGSTHGYYSPITPLLTAAPHNFRCISYDTISSGLSSLATEPQTIQTLAEDAIAVLDALDVTEQVVVVGHSMGGVVVAELAATRGERFLGAVMLGPVLPGGAAFKAAFEERIAKVQKAGKEALADTTPSAATGPHTTPLQKSFIRALLLSQQPAGYFSMCSATGNASPPDYDRIKVPTLLVAGDRDVSAPLEQCREIFGRVGGGKKRMEVLGGVGHWFCVEDAGGVGGLVAGFVEEVVGNDL